jgi:hypothetical protein
MREGWFNVYAFPGGRPVFVGVEWPTRGDAMRAARRERRAGKRLLYRVHAREKPELDKPALSPILGAG